MNQDTAVKRFKFYCPSCQKEQDFVLLDGYSVGDRLLEGVMFEVRLKKGKKYSIKPSSVAEKYLESLNRKKWLEAMQEYAYEVDSGQCPKCKEEINMPFMKVETKPAVKMVKMGNLNEMLFGGKKSGDGVYEATVKMDPRLMRGQVWCRKCGNTQKVNSVQCLRIGWPKCCDQTMTLDSPTELPNREE